MAGYRDELERLNFSAEEKEALTCRLLERRSGQEEKRPRFPYTHVLESARRTVISVADDHLVLHHQCTHFAPLAVAVFRPDAGHAQIAQIQFVLFFLSCCHVSCRFVA